MALANFFDRAATAASQILADFQFAAFKETLGAQVVGLAFDGPAVDCEEGRATLDLAVRILARLYPAVALRALDGKAKSYRPTLVDLAKSINPKIAVGAPRKALTSCLVVGATAIPAECPLFYLGSDGWVAKLSSRRPVGSGTSSNMFGAGAAACFGTANIFRSIFGGQLAGGSCDDEISLSLLDFTQAAEVTSNHLPDIDLGDVQFVGLGAVGNGAVWALGKTSGLRGQFDVIDHETIDLSNLQRYVLATQNDVGSCKAAKIAGLLSRPGLTVTPYAMRWGDFVGQRADWRFERVIVGLDTARDRIGVQASLPKWIGNAWTQEMDLGISSHAFDNAHPCLACLYIPSGQVKNEDEKLAEELRMPEASREIRTLLQTGAGLDEPLIRRVAAAFSIPFESLQAFVGQPLRVFYQSAICGGLVMRLTDGTSGTGAVVPMAFQSALAGILLAATLVKSVMGTETVSSATTRINLLRPLAPFLRDPKAKDSTGHCICADPQFLSAYRLKYQPSSPI